MVGFSRKQSLRWRLEFESFTMEPLGITSQKRRDESRIEQREKSSCFAVSTKSAADSTGLSKARMTFLCCPESTGEVSLYIPTLISHCMQASQKRALTLGEAALSSPCNPQRGLTVEGSLLEALPASGRVKPFIPERGSGWYVKVSTTPHIRDYLRQIFLAQRITLCKGGYSYETFADRSQITLWF